MFKRSHYIAFGLVAVLALVFLNLPGRASSRVKLAIGSLFLPLFGLKSSAQHVGDSGNTNEQVRVIALENQALKDENARLRKLVGWQPQPGWKLKLAKVILRDPANWWSAVQIDLGSRDGIKENMTVLTPEGLVGRVGTVAYTNSKVFLIGDPACPVSALVGESREMGIVGKASALDHSLVEMNNIAATANLKPGQDVTTSGLGGIFRKGIPVGKVADARQVEYGLTMQAHVKLAVNLSTIEEVWVLLQ